LRRLRQLSDRPAISAACFTSSNQKQTKYPAKPGLAAAGLLYSEADSKTDSLAI
jgi:hypothetical protein